MWKTSEAFARSCSAQKHSSTHQYTHPSRIHIHTNNCPLPRLHPPISHHSSPKTQQNSTKSKPIFHTTPTPSFPKPIIPSFPISHQQLIKVLRLQPGCIVPHKPGNIHHLQLLLANHASLIPHDLPQPDHTLGTCLHVPTAPISSPFQGLSTHNTAPIHPSTHSPHQAWTPFRATTTTTRTTLAVQKRWMCQVVRKGGGVDIKSGVLRIKVGVGGFCRRHKAKKWSTVL